MMEEKKTRKNNIVILPKAITMRKFIINKFPFPVMRARNEYTVHTVTHTNAHVCTDFINSISRISADHAQPRVNRKCTAHEV